MTEVKAKFGSERLGKIEKAVQETIDWLGANQLAEKSEAEAIIGPLQGMI